MTFESRSFTFVSEGRVPESISRAVRDAVLAARGESLKLTMPIRFLPMNTTNSRMLPFMLIQFVIGWSRNLAADTKQRAKGIMWVKSSVKSERKLIQVGL